MADNPIESPVIALIGPTAIGKTELSLRIAEQFSAEIVSADSMQVYRHMDIGTAKVSMEERARVPHYLIDMVEPDEEYHVARYIKDAVHACNSIIAHAKIPLLVGGTGLYLKGLLEGLFELPATDPAIRGDLKKMLAEEGIASLYEELHQKDPVTASRLHPHDTHRILRALEILRTTGTSWSEHLAQQKRRPLLQHVLKIGLSCDREELYNRINKRVVIMVQQGLREEVEKLLNMGYHRCLKSMQSIGYRHMVNFLEGRWSWEQSIELLARDTRRYAKRQYTWFRRDPQIQWFQPAQEKEIFNRIEKIIEKK